MCCDDGNVTTILVEFKTGSCFPLSVLIWLQGLSSKHFERKKKSAVLLPRSCFDDTASVSLGCALKNNTRFDLFAALTVTLTVLAVRRFFFLLFC